MRCATAISSSAFQAGLLGGLTSVGLGDIGVLLGAGGLGTPEVFQVGALGGDVLDLEGVQHQALAGQACLGLLGDLPGERRPVADGVLHRHLPHDRAQRAGEHFLGEADDAVLLLQEALRRGADGVLVAADLDDRHAFEVRLDAAQGDRAANGDGDVPAGQVEGVALLDEADDEHPTADDDFLAAVVGEHLSGVGVGGLLAAPAGDDECLAGPGDLVAGDNDQGEQDEEHEHSHDRDDD